MACSLIYLAQGERHATAILKGFAPELAELYSAEFCRRAPAEV